MCTCICAGSKINPSFFMHRQSLQISEAFVLWIPQKLDESSIGSKKKIDLRSALLFGNHYVKNLFVRVGRKDGRDNRHKK